MPTENEVKFVLQNDLEVVKFLSKNSDCIKHITQSYLHNKSGWNARIRHIVSDNEETYTYTYKNKKHGRTIEIESEITRNDYYDLIEDAKFTMNKTRLVFDTDDHVWEVDLFLDEEDIYFVMAEVEMEEGLKKPKSIPEMISQYIVYDAGYSKKFSNTKIAERDYAEELYQLIMSGRFKNG